MVDTSKVKEAVKRLTVLTDNNSRLQEVMDKLEQSLASMRRTTALMRMSLPGNEYRPLIR